MCLSYVGNTVVFGNDDVAGIDSKELLVLSG